MLSSVILYWITTAVFFLAGASLFVWGIIFRHRMTTEDTSSFGAHRGEGATTITFAGALAWPGLGLVCFLLCFLAARYGLIPSQAEYKAAQQAASAAAETKGAPTQTEATPKPSKPSSEPTLPPPVSFTTPRGVVCSTYVDEAAMACVSSEHSWGDPNCKYSFTLRATGAATVEKCPARADLIESLSGYPDAPAKVYGQTVDLGVARCVLSSEGTFCVNADRHYLRVTTQHSYPKVTQ